MKLNNDELTTSAYIKPTYRHQCLYYIGHHIRNILNGQFFCSQTLRASRLCSFKEDFVDHSEKIKIWFSERGYLDKIIENKMDKVNFGQRRSKTKFATGVPFFVTYHLRLKVLGKIIHENLNLLYMNDEVKDNFTLEPMVSFRTAENLVVIWLEPNYTY